MRIRSSPDQTTLGSDRRPVCILGYVAPKRWAGTPKRKNGPRLAPSRPVYCGFHPQQPDEASRERETGLTRGGRIAAALPRTRIQLSLWAVHTTAAAPPLPRPERGPSAPTTHVITPRDNGCEPV